MSLRPITFGPLYDGLVQIQVFGTKEAAKLAEEAFSVLSGGVFLGKQVPHDVLAPLQSATRRDLSILSLAQDCTVRSGSQG